MSDESDSYNPSHRPPSTQAAGRTRGTLDVRERGADRNGEPQLMDRRLFVQLLVFQETQAADGASRAARISGGLSERQVPHVVYADVNDPRGVGVLTFSEDPQHFVAQVRPVLGAPEFAALRLRPELTMLGRTYSSGYEDDLVHWLLDRPRKTMLHPSWPWAIWYPLRRTGAFEQLGKKEQSEILREHAAIGRAYGEDDLAHDVRLACHGLDANDNEFVIGLIGKDLYPLSYVVQTMRKTRQTSEYIAHMGPFFVGKVVHSSTHG